jgi:Amt family ammonium transporter
MRKIILSVLITILYLLFQIILTDSPAPAEAVKFDTGDTAWMIVATALVLIMTPGLGFFMVVW